MPDSMQLAAYAGIIIVCLAALAAGLNQIDEYFKRRAGLENKHQVGPQPFTVKEADRYVAVDTFEKHVAENSTDHKNLFAKIGGVERGFREELKQDTAALHEKINKVDREVAGVSKGMEFQNQQLASINGTLLRLLNDRGSSSLP